MRCPYCSSDNDRVIDSRAIEERAIKVIKKDGARVPFEREKLKAGIEKACWKRPVSDAQIESLISDVENDVLTNFDAEVDSGYLGERVMSRLRELDQVAYVRFASVYRQFKDVRDFVEELEPMLRQPPK
jgi:transcriptional repressor NrdR